MLDLRRRRSVRTGTLAGLVRVHAALHAPADGGADAGHRRERVTENQCDDARQIRYVVNDDADRHQYVAQRHDRHDDLREMCDSFNAAENDEPEHRHHGHGGNQFRQAYGIAEKVDHRFAADGELGGVTDAV